MKSNVLNQQTPRHVKAYKIHSVCGTMCCCFLSLAEAQESTCLISWLAVTLFVSKLDERNSDSVFSAAPKFSSDIRVQIQIEKTKHRLMSKD